ncbi:hypothetical protein OAE97_02470 [Verrucomicrobia bacterium]|jgi:hypothetical protein|nr:hypothetical protein [Verrucomicrobiota bacterium]MDB4665187.1 hypothetical protein [Verrucomicrobiota bacterium]MDG1890910.1 hypothetical protein [Verrucomicrobiota bacterium]
MFYLSAIIGSILSLLGMLAILMLSVRYRVQSQCLKISCMGLTVRRFSLKEVTSVSKRRRYAAEHWINTFQTKHRRLVIRRERGVFKEIVITPRYRYVFRRKLEEAVATCRGTDIS